MKKIALMAVVCAFVTVPVLADQVTTIDGYGIWQTGTGGEFTLKPSNDLAWVLAYYDASTKNQGTQVQPGSFQSFCVEESEYIYANTTFDVVLNNNAVAGGGGGGWPNGDPISVGTAWLYHMFQIQDPALGYDYSAAGRKVSAAALQNAIWYLEQEPGALDAHYTGLLTGKFGTVANAMQNNNGAYPVEVLNLYVPGHVGERDYLRQDVLVCVPVPGAVLLGLLGLGAAGVRLRRFA